MPRQTRPGFSLLELLVTAALMATIVTSASLVLRSAQTAWTMHASDQSRLDAAYASLRHITRHVRQAEGVTAITSASDLSGGLAVLLPDGNIAIWDHAGTEIHYGIGAPSALLASGVSELSFVGYEADGVTITTTPADIQSVVCTIRVPLERTNAPSRAIRARIWLRAW